MKHLDLFCEYLAKISSELGEYMNTHFISSGLIHEIDDRSHNFTAMASLFFLNKTASNSVSIWNFRSSSFEELLTLHSDGEVKLNFSSDHPFAHHKRFKGTKSRKGFLQTRWKFFEAQIDLVRLSFRIDFNSHSLDQCASLP